MPHGWVGKTLRVDLTNRKIGVEDTMNWAERFIGGVGVAAKIFFDEVNDDVAAFDPDNLLMFMTGPLSGTMAPGSGRSLMCGRSPFTHPKEIFTYSSFGGDWGPHLKYAGYDNVIVKGKADKPVYIYIEDGEVQILDADTLWGLDTFATQEMAIRIHGSDVKTACIGEAGENLARIATIQTDSGSAAGAGGFGGVMGSKNLKAIVVKGNGAVTVPNASKALEVSKYVSRLINKPEKPSSGHDGYPRIGGFTEENVPAWSKKHRVRGSGCFGCAVNCRGYFKPPSGPSGQAQCFEFFYYSLFTDFSKGFDHQIIKGDENWHAKNLLDKAGLNNVEVFYHMIFVLNCIKRGIITEEILGVEIPKEIYNATMDTYHFGSAPDDHTFIDKLLRSIIYRYGFGDKLAEGLARAAESLGEEAWDEYVKLYTTRGYIAHHADSVAANLLWALDSRDPIVHDPFYIHIYKEQVPELVTMIYGLPPESAADDNYEYAPEIMHHYRHSQILKNVLQLCDWCHPPGLACVGYYPPEALDVIDMEVPAKLYTAITGIESTRESLEEVSTRIATLLRAVQIAEGRTPEEDSVYHEKFEEPFLCQPPYTYMVAGPLDKTKFDDAKNRYFEKLGWERGTGRPTRSALESLDLKDVADKLESLGKLP